MSLFTRSARPGEHRNADRVLSAALRAMGISTKGSVVGPITADRALAHDAVWACVNLLANLVSTMPVDTFTKRPGAVRPVPIENPPIIAKPSADVFAIDWRRQVMVSWLVHGQAWGGVVSTDRLGYPTQIETLSADVISATVKRGGGVQWKLDGKPVERFPRGELWTVPGAYTIPGSPIGLSPVGYAKRAIELGLVAQAFGRDWFDNGAHPGAVLQSDKVLDPAEAARIKERFVASIASGEPAVLGAGLEYEPVEVAAEESQFLATIQANTATVARFFGVDPSLIGGSSGDPMTYSNVEQRVLNLLTFAVGPYLVRWDYTLGDLLPAEQTTKINADAVLRVEAKTRAEIASLKIRSGIWNSNDAREKEDEDPIPGGDRFVWPPFSTAPQQSDTTRAASDVAAIGAAVQKLYLGVGPGEDRAVLTRAEARTLLRTLGVELDPAHDEGIPKP